MKFEVKGTVESVKRNKGFDGKEDYDVIEILARIPNNGVEIYRPKWPENRIAPKVGDKFEGCIEVGLFTNPKGETRQTVKVV